MYAITGITGQIGGVIGRILLGAGQPVRAVLRDIDKGRAWTDRGCEEALAAIEDAASLTAAFRGAEGVFVLVPPNFDPQPGFPEARAIGAALRSALETARPARVVYLSTIGAQASQPNLLTQHTIIEQALSDLPVPITFLRPRRAGKDRHLARTNRVHRGGLHPHLAIYYQARQRLSFSNAFGHP